MLLSLAVVAGCTLTYAALHVATSPFLDVERARHQMTEPVQPDILSTEVLDDVSRYFVAHPWVAESGKHFRDNGRYLFCKELTLSKDRRSVVASPVAMLWRSESEDVPVTVVAESAQLFSKGEFSLENASLGELSGGLIRGNVQVRGPKNLRVSGGTFYLQNHPLQLRSSDQIDFAWDRHDGVAASGVQILFDAASSESEYAGLKRIQLLGRVLCNFIVSGSQPGQQPTHIQVNAARGFVFDNGRVMKTGTFSGLDQTASASRPLNPRNEVWVRQLTPDGPTNELVCPELRMTFSSSPDQSGTDAEDASLQLEHMQAWGRRVEIRSPEQNVSVLANDLQYFVPQRKLEIRNSSNKVSENQKYVTVQRGRSRLKVPSIRIVHTEDNELQRLECLGKGGLLAVEEPDPTKPQSDIEPSKLIVQWGRSLVFQAAPNGIEKYLTLNGGGAITELSRKLGLSSDQITMTLLQPPVEEDKDRPAVVEVQDPNEFSADGMFDGLEPKLLTASGNVVVKSTEGSGQLRDNLTVRFQRAPKMAAVQQVSASVEVDPVTEPVAAPATAEFTFESDSGNAVVTLPDESSDAEDEIPAYEVWLNGNISVTRNAENAEQAFTAFGNQLVATNDETRQRTIQLFGDPARVHSSTRNLEGPRIDLNEVAGQADVVGSGHIRFVTTSRPYGEEEGEPIPIDIYWSDQMTFRRRVGRFHGKVRVVMKEDGVNDVEIQCDGLTVELAEDISLDSADGSSFRAKQLSDQDDPEDEPSLIRKLTCHNRVVVRIEQFEDGVLNGRHNAEFADLQVDLQSGDFQAVGPGFLKSVAPDREGQLQQSQPVTARANTPSRTSDNGFVYLRTDFVGAVTGNIGRREATLSQNVVALMTPVRRVDERLDLHQVPTADLPELAGILQAEELTIGAIWGSSDRPESFSLIGRRNARLNSREISASADVITYDHEKEQFIIRAEGENTVTVNHRSGPGGRFNRTNGTRFEYYRKTNQLKADRIDALNLNR